MKRFVAVFMLLGSLIPVGSAVATTVYNETFTASGTYNLNGVQPNTGQPWSVTQGTQDVSNNAIAILPASDMQAFGGFTNALSSGTLTLSVNFSAITCNGSNGNNTGVSLYVGGSGGAEKIFVGCSGGYAGSLRVGFNGQSANLAVGNGTAGTVTITYSYSSGAYTVQAPGGSQVTGTTTAGLAIDTLRVANAIAVSGNTSTISVTNFLVTLPAPSDTSQIVHWNLPTVYYGGCGKTLHGSFDYDAYYNQYTNVDLKYYDCNTTNTLTQVSSGSSNLLMASTNGQNGDPSAVLSDITPPLSNSGGTVSLTASVGEFNGTTSLTSAVSSAATLSEVSSIPSLSEWAQLMLALMVIGIAWHFHNNRQNSY